MKQITKTYTVYSFDELSEKAKEKAIEKQSDCNVDSEWWESDYDDANNVGIEITGFDLDRGNYCNGNISDPLETAHKIISEHGEVCETFKTATAFLKERDEIVNAAPKDENGEFADQWELDEKLDDCESEFKKSILEDYRVMLQKTYDYLTSREAIIETIEANEWTFLEDGTMKNF